MSKFINVILSAFGIALLFNIALFRPFGVTGIVISCFIFLGYLLFVYPQNQFKPYLAILSSIIVIYGALVINRASGPAVSLLLLGILGAFALILYLLGSGKDFVHSVGELAFIPLLLATSYLITLFETLSRLLHLPFNTKSSNTMIKNHGFSALLGVIVAVPILLLLVGLLSQADPIFNNSVKHFFSFLSWNELYTRIIVTSVLFFGLVPWGLLKIHVSSSSPLSSFTTKNAVVPLIIIMGSVTIVLLLFLVIQWPYVFANVAAEADLSKFGVATYSEYVKRGFAEFLMVAVILYSLLWMGLTAYRSHPAREGKILFVIQTVATALFLLFIVSVLRRILLYWDLHGLSLIRVYGGLFLFLVMALTTTLYLRHISKIRFIVIELASITVFLCILGIWNQEEFIINNHPPTVNGQIDYVYLSRLSEDSVDGWIQSYRFAQNSLAKYSTRNQILLNAEDRRNIAYSGYIVSILTHHYDTLIRIYASEVERSAYRDALIAWHIEAINELLGQHETDVRVNNLEMTNYWERMSQIKSQLATDTISLSPRSTFWMTQYTEGFCTNWQSTMSIVNCIPSFYTVGRKPILGPRKFIDTIFIWNASALHAYTSLSESIPIESLLATQKEYTVLMKQIMSQAPEERTTAFDISFDTPLIEPIH
jgi:hypothetical protein